MVLQRPIGRRLERERRYLAADQNVGSVKSGRQRVIQAHLTQSISLIWDLLSHYNFSHSRLPLGGGQVHEGRVGHFFQTIAFFS